MYNGNGHAHNPIEVVQIDSSDDDDCVILSQSSQQPRKKARGVAVVPVPAPAGIPTPAPVLVQVPKPAPVPQPVPVPKPAPVPQLVPVPKPALAPVPQPVPVPKPAPAAVPMAPSIQVESPASNGERRLSFRRLSTTMLPPADPQPGPSHENFGESNAARENFRAALKRRRSSTKTPPARRPSQAPVPNGVAGSPPNRTEARRLSVENQIVILMKKIDEIDEQEVDLDDDVNSAYLRKDKLTTRLLSAYQRLAEHYGANGRLTDRPMQKRFRIQEVTKYPEIDCAVETFINNFCKPSARNKKEVAYAAPEYNDILDVVRTTISEKHIPVVDGEERATSLELFKHIVKEYKRRRAKELKIALPKLFEPTIPENDPAETNEELKRQLEINVRLRRTEEQVLNEFAERELLHGDVEEQEGMDDEDDDDDDENEENQNIDDCEEHLIDLE